MTMLELAERLGNAGFSWLRRGLLARGADRAASPRRPGGGRPPRRPRDRGHRPAGDVPRPRRAPRRPVTVGPAEASIVKLYYSELLQRLTDFGADVVGLAGQTGCASRSRAAGSRVRGCSTSSARGSGPSRAGRARSNGRSSVSGASVCRGSRRWHDRDGVPRVPRRAAGRGPRPAGPHRPERRWRVVPGTGGLVPAGGRRLARPGAARTARRGRCDLRRGGGGARGARAGGDLEPLLGTVVTGGGRWRPSRRERPRDDLLDEGRRGGGDPGRGPRRRRRRRRAGTDAVPSPGGPWRTAAARASGLRARRRHRRRPAGRGARSPTANRYWCAPIRPRPGCSSSPRCSSTRPIPWPRCPPMG